MLDRAHLRLSSLGVRYTLVLSGLKTAPALQLVIRRRFSTLPVPGLRTVTLVSLML